MAARSEGGFEVALNHLRQEILTGRQPRGSRLPPERELAAQLGVGRGAVREAIRVLQAQGILVSTTGPGNGTRVEPAHIEAIGDILQLHLALDSVSFGDVSETRAALERAAMVSAARRREPRALAEATRLHEAMRATLEPREFNELDTAFHIALATAGDNALLGDLAVAIRRAVHSPILEAEHSLADWPGFHRQLVEQHQGMLAAVVAGDEGLAAERVESHVRHSYRALLGP